MKRPAFILSGLFSMIVMLCAISAHADSSPVVVSIKPLHSLVAAVMEGTGTPELLVGGMQSPHGYQLKPSQVASLQHAAIIFYIGPGLETFLTRTLQSLPPGVKTSAMIDAPGVTVLPARTGGAWEPDEDEPEESRAQDPHIWLDAGNAKAMATRIAADLSALYPQNAARYQENAVHLTEKLDALDTELKATLAPVKGRPHIVFHDAFQYFDRAYGLNAVGSITLEPEQEPGARRIEEIRQRVGALHVSCVFSEPQFNARLVQTVTEGTGARIGTTDEHGADLAEGPDLYFTLMLNLARNFKSCLSNQVQN